MDSFKMPDRDSVGSYDMCVEGGFSDPLARSLFGETPTSGFVAAVTRRPDVCNSSGDEDRVVPAPDETEL